MNMKSYAFFSSDARELYKIDIFRSLSLPNNHVIKLRYIEDYISDDILDKLSSIKNSEGILFFSSGNKLDEPKEKRKIINT